ncbi:hypothetical protein [Mycolicibacterium arenosum]|uniref:PE-PGRS family protein n=1 Tax=Mycolicibacterium arenosum TaxID=2952157 RepID=A0ABT1M5L9_9MYCO|nr:hypothetical protein [Mycolicibacterium sp. CAU 1645]MCP9274448.1 hypothetical protein [Mycolicibacterium sp. CAU 1645]
MQPALPSAAPGCDATYPDVAPSRTKMLVAGVAVASVGVLALHPVMTAPAIEESRKAAVELSAVTNPLTTLQTTFTNTFTNLTALNTNATTSATALATALSNPAVQAQFTGILTAATDPTRILGALSELPGYAQRLAAAQAGSSSQFQEAISLLPGVLQVSAGFLAEGKFLESFAEINLWFLTAGLSDLRGSALDALRVPGDFLDSIGLEPLARILGTSWMDEGTNGPGFGRGLLSRGIAGNFGRAVLGPPVTAVFQTVEIMDAVRGALQTGDLETAVSELVNAPIKIVNAFVNGYVPAFVTDPNSPIPPGPGQTFPGLIGPTGSFDFIFRQIPAEIAAALQVPRPAPAVAPAGAPSAARVAAESESPSALPGTDDAQLLTVDVPAPAATPEPAPEPQPETAGTPAVSGSTETPEPSGVSTASTTSSDEDGVDVTSTPKSTSKTSPSSTTDAHDADEAGGSESASTASAGASKGSTTSAASSTSGGDSGGDSAGGDE